MLKFGSLFSGIGGFDRGFEQANLECAWQVEIDRDCKRVLRRHWPNVELFDDVRTVEQLPDVDVLCGGFPCQDLSVAGKRKGLAGERSGLWFEFLRIAELNKPRWIVIENVPGLLSSESGTDFRIIISGLVNVGYCVAWRVLDAQYFGVAQRRRRVFIVGSFGDGSCAEILFESESVPWNPPARREAGAGTTEVSVRRAQTSSNGWGIRTDGSTGTLDGTGGDAVIAGPVNQKPGFRGWASDDEDLVAVSLCSHAGLHDSGGQQNFVTHSLRSEGADASEDGTGRGTPIVVAATLNSGGKPGQGYQATLGNFGVRRLTPRECERLQGFPDDWTLYDGEGKEISDSARYRMLGNAVAVPCSEWLGKRIEQHSTD